MNNTKPSNNKYFNNFSGLDCPWVESPFFYRLLENSDLSEYEKSLATQFHEEGYVIVDLGLSDAFLDRMIGELKGKLAEGKYKSQEEGYHYSKYPRLFEAWKWSETVLDVVKNEKILGALHLLYNRKPCPFQTINFVGGTSQPLHSDQIHFHTIPERWLAAVWVALEDADEENGALMYVPKSHKLPHYEFTNLNVEVPKYGEQFEAYSKYEEFIKQLVVARNLEVKTLKIKKGKAIIWASNLLHGGIPIIDESRTRFSQATHYYFEGCRHYYSPMFSDSQVGKFSEKNIKEKDIINYKIDYEALADYYSKKDE